VQCRAQDAWGTSPLFISPGCAEEGEEAEDRDGGTYVQEILHGGVKHHQVCEEGAKVGNGALHHALQGQKGQQGQERAGTSPGSRRGGGMGGPCQAHHLSLLLLPLLSPLRVDLQGGEFGRALLDGGERWGSARVGNCANR